MIKALNRTFFFSVPSLKHLSDADKLEQLKNLEASYTRTFSKDYQQEIRAKKQEFSQEQLEKIELILTQMNKMSSFEILALRKSILDDKDSEYQWPVFYRPNELSKRITKETTLGSLGTVSDSIELINKVISGTSDGLAPNQEIAKEEVKKVVKEKTTFNLVLTGFDPNSKVKFIKCIKDVMGLGLKESKEKAEESNKGPVVLFKSVSKDSHGKILEQLIQAGGQAEFQ